MNTKLYAWPNLKSSGSKLVSLALLKMSFAGRCGWLQQNHASVLITKSRRRVRMYFLREFVKTHVILTPGALLVGWEPHFVLHFRGIRGIRGGAQKLIFEQ